MCKTLCGKPKTYCVRKTFSFKKKQKTGLTATRKISRSHVAIINERRTSEKIIRLIDTGQKDMNDEEVIIQRYH